MRGKALVKCAMAAVLLVCSCSRTLQEGSNDNGDQAESVKSILQDERTLNAQQTSGITKESETTEDIETMEEAETYKEHGTDEYISAGEEGMMLYDVFAFEGWTVEGAEQKDLMYYKHFRTPCILNTSIELYKDTDEKAGTIAAAEGTVMFAEATDRVEWVYLSSTDESVQGWLHISNRDSDNISQTLTRDGYVDTYRLFCTDDTSGMSFCQLNADVLKNMNWTEDGGIKFAIVKNADIKSFAEQNSAAFSEFENSQGIQEMAGGSKDLILVEYYSLCASEETITFVDTVGTSDDAAKVKLRILRYCKGGKLTNKTASCVVVALDSDEATLDDISQIQIVEYDDNGQIY